MNSTCPQCGDLLDLHGDKSIKLSTCLSCNSSLLIEDNTISLTALNVVKNTEKSLFKIDNIISIKNKVYLPKGYSLYSYEDGTKVEWELSDDEDNSYFLNQEDENLFLVKKISKIRSLPSWESLQPNTHLKIKKNEWLVVEKLQVSFESYYGDLQNLPKNNQKLKCSYLSNTQGECLVLAWKGKSHKAYQGWWLDPMDLI